ncbi:MAG: hypothetical protein ACFFDT_37755 [Candidatus Hodarchaeota archaeon]
MKSDRMKLTSPEAFMNAFNRSGQFQDSKEKKPIGKQDVSKSVTNG